ncbi:hypothetical protein LOK49_LG10G00261 [Camellia lanceoleosa]|uniref:Uncharacterized protein n=1 Tax=Camellia lanceoleosa TaxID=1840588 RepID=A0ACC0G7E1_9ERIC|nr:hypothetical protein LOK49_LG10G00261 [Camellia lanceoleosa]
MTTDEPKHNTYSFTQTDERKWKAVERRMTVVGGSFESEIVNERRVKWLWKCQRKPALVTKNKEMIEKDVREEGRGMAEVVIVDTMRFLCSPLSPWKKALVLSLDFFKAMALLGF